MERGLSTCLNGLDLSSPGGKYSPHEAITCIPENNWSSDKEPIQGSISNSSVELGV